MSDDWQDFQETHAAGRDQRYQARPAAAVSRSLFAGNPMMAEPGRLTRQVLHPSDWKGQQVVMGVIVGIIFAVFIAMTVFYWRAMEPAVMVYVMLGLLLLIIPLNLHGVIAGEREKRSLEMLLAAPVTGAQIIVAKLARSVIPVTLTIVGFGIPAYVLGFKRMAEGYSESPVGGVPELVGVTSGIFMTFVFAYFLAAGTVYISTLTKSMASALISSIGAIFMYIAIIPAILGLAAGILGNAEPVALINPFSALTMLTGGWHNYITNWMGIEAVYIISIPLWLGLGTLFIYLSAQRVEADRRQGDRRRGK